MQYTGGKHRLAKSIVPALLEVSQGKTKYVEPFLGGGSMFAAMSGRLPKAYGNDKCYPLASMWCAVLSGWDPPRVVTPEDYQAAKLLPDNDPLKAFIGFGCSFGAKWFGGYATNARGDDFAGAARNGVLRKAAKFNTKHVWSLDFSQVPVDSSCLVYCDPPYAGTQKYGATDAFDHSRFWSTAKSWRDLGAQVVVSEYTAPPEWSILREFEHVRNLNKNEHTKVTERLLWIP